MDEGKTKYTTIQHDIRHKFHLSTDEYCLADSIHKLSNTVDFPWCKMDKGKLGNFIGISERSVYRKLAKLAKKGLIEQTAEGLRSKPLWRDTVEFQTAKVTKRTDKVADNNNTNKSLYQNKESEVFNLKEILQIWESGPVRRMDIIAWFIRTKGLAPKSKAELDIIVGRHIRDAQKLEKAGYTDEQLVAAAKKASGYDWTVGSLVKELTK